MNNHEFRVYPSTFRLLYKINHIYKLEILILLNIDYIFQIKHIPEYYNSIFQLNKYLGKLQGNKIENGL